MCERGVWVCVRERGCVSERGEREGCVCARERGVCVCERGVCVRERGVCEREGGV